MFVDKKSQGKGAASKILKELELWTKELGYEKCILETGIKQTRAIALYKRNNFEIIENYGQYKHIKKRQLTESNAPASPSLTDASIGVRSHRCAIRISKMLGQSTIFQS